MKNAPKHKLDEAYRGLRFLGLVSKQEEFGDILGYSKSHFSQIMNEAQPFPEAIKDKCYSEFGLSKQWWDTPTGTPLDIIPKNTTNVNPGLNATSDEIRALAASLFKKIPQPIIEDIDNLKSISDRIKEIARQIAELENMKKNEKKQ